MAFVGYGGVGGARAVEQLRLNAIELQMAPIRVGVHIQVAAYLAVLKGEKTLNDFPELVQGAKDMLDQFVWWLNALKAARAQDVIAEQNSGLKLPACCQYTDRRS